jgi:type I restriction enzyme S subunit
VHPTEFGDAAVFYYSIPALEKTGDGIRVSASEIESAKLLLTGGELLVSKLNPRKGRVLIARAHELPVLASGEFIALRAEKVDVRYASYLLQSEPMRQYLHANVRSVTRSHQRFDPAVLLNAWVALPPLPEQVEIVQHLGRELKRVDELASAKVRHLRAFEERSGAFLMLRVLTGGNEHTGGTSPSGLYPSVPDGWREVRLGRLGCEVQTGPFGSQLHASDYLEGGWPVVNPTNIDNGSITAAPDVAISDDKKSELARHVLRRGDIVLARRGQMGRAALVGEEEAGWVCGTGCMQIRIRKETALESSYLALLLQAPPARAYFEAMSVGSTMDNLNLETVRALPVLLPPIATQRNIVLEIARYKSATSRLSTTIREQLDLLADSRRALITEFMTGARDVTAAA